MNPNNMKQVFQPILIVLTLTGWLSACSDEADSQDAGSDATSDTVFGFDAFVDSGSPDTGTDAEADGQLPDTTPDGSTDAPPPDGVADTAELPNDEVGPETGDDLPPPCIDVDGDGRGENCEAGPDCSDENENTWDTCETCNDDDEDERWFDCNQYLPFGQPDCDPGSGFRFQIAFFDLDGDGMASDTAAELCIGDMVPGFTMIRGDCDDQDAAANPMMIEIPLDGLDNDCMMGDLETLTNDGYIYLDPQFTGEGSGTMAAPFSVFYDARDAAAACEPDCAIIAAGATIGFNGTYNPVSVSILGGYNHAAAGTWSFGALDTYSTFNIEDGYQMVVDAPDRVLLYRLAINPDYSFVTEPTHSLVSVSPNPLVVFYHNLFSIVNTNSGLQSTIIDAPTGTGELFVVHNTFDINQTTATTNGDIRVVAASVGRAIVSSNVFNIPGHELGQLDILSLECAECAITNNTMDYFISSGPMHFAKVEGDGAWILIRNNRLVGESSHEAFFFDVHAPDGWVTAASNWIDLDEAVLPGVFDFSASHNYIHNNAIYVTRLAGQTTDPFAIQIGSRFTDHHADALLTNNMITVGASGGNELSAIRFDGSRLVAIHNTFIGVLDSSEADITAGVLNINVNFESVALVNNVFEMLTTAAGSTIRILDGTDPTGDLTVFHNAFFITEDAPNVMSGFTADAIETASALNDGHDWASGNIEDVSWGWDFSETLPELPIDHTFPGIDAGIDPRDIGLFAVPIDRYGTIRPVDGNATDGPQYDMGAMEYVP